MHVVVTLAEHVSLEIVCCRLWTKCYRLLQCMVGLVVVVLDLVVGRVSRRHLGWRERNRTCVTFLHPARAPRFRAPVCSRSFRELTDYTLAIGTVRYGELNYERSYRPDLERVCLLSLVDGIPDFLRSSQNTCKTCPPTVYTRSLARPGASCTTHF